MPPFCHFGTNRRGGIYASLLPFTAAENQPRKQIELQGREKSLPYSEKGMQVRTVWIFWGRRKIIFSKTTAITITP